MKTRDLPAAWPAPTLTPMACSVNGEAHALEVAAHHTLLDVLRDRLGLTGTKSCCVQGECGACTVLIDGRAVNACLVLAVEADGRAIITIEGLAADDRLDPVQEAFLDQGAVQCGFCIPGMIMSAKYLLMHHARPSVDEIKDALAGNLCRCAGYSRIVAAVVDAATRGDSTHGAERTIDAPAIDTPRQEGA